VHSEYQNHHDFLSRKSSLLIKLAEAKEDDNMMEITSNIKKLLNVFIAPSPYLET